MQGGFRRQLRHTLFLFGVLAATTLSPATLADFVLAERISANSPSLDADFSREAWLVYTYRVDANGQVVDAQIRQSNGVESANRSIIEQVEALQYHPATRDGRPTEVSMGPVVYTWILDVPRQLDPAFSQQYEQAWSLFRQGDYLQAASLARQLGDMPGRNAYEEVKYQILAASLASRQQDLAMELYHLNRIMALQDLADLNNFEHPYVDASHYALMMARVHELLLENNQLADAQELFSKLLRFGVSDDILQRARNGQQQAQLRWNSLGMATTRGEIKALYPGGDGNWKAGLSREHFSIDSVEGSINWVFLTCGNQEQRLSYPSTAPWQIPAGWRDCGIEVGGKDGTRFKLQQLR